MLVDYGKIKKVIDENSNVVEFGKFGQGISDSWIEKAQNRLGIKFPPSYVWWLKNYNGGEINGEEVFSIYEIDFDSVVGGDIVYMNELSRKNGNATNQQLIIQENDQGESYYFNLDEVDDNGESPIYIDINKSKYADDFLDFITKKISE